MDYRPGPGLLVAAAFLGPGTLATATLAGSQAGYELLWTVPLAVLVAFVVQELAARLGLRTGRPLARLIAEEGPGGGSWARGLAYASVAAVVLGAAAFQAGNLAGASLGLTVLTEGPSWLWVIAVADVAFLLLWFSRYEGLEAVLGSLVALMAAAFAVQLGLLGLDGGALLAGLVPSLDGTSIGLVLALVGTTVVPYNLFLHGSALDADANHDRDSLTSMRTDLAISLLLGGLITASVLVSAAATLGGARVTNAADMAIALRPLLGPLAEVTIGLGLAAAGLTSAVTAPLAAAWAVDQLREADPARPSRTVWAPVLLFGTGLALLPFEPVGLIVTAQVANALVLPLLVGACLWVANRVDADEGANGWLANAAALAAFALTLGLAWELLGL
jgi:NRAMP (natural resistance-associated macrophage protein)-like metal ion transporter